MILRVDVHEGRPIARDVRLGGYIEIRAHDRGVLVFPAMICAGLAGLDGTAVMIESTVGSGWGLGRLQGESRACVGAAPRELDETDMCATGNVGRVEFTDSAPGQPAREHAWSGWGEARLGIPREAMGLSYGAYAEGTAPEPGEEIEDVLRRQFQHLLALAGVAAFGSAIPGVGELLAGSSSGGLPVDTPGRIGRADVETIVLHTDHLRAVARTFGGQAEPAVALAQWADSWLDADASQSTRQALLSALSDLHVVAAWCCHDSYAPVPAHHHFAQAVRLATEAQDGYRASYALRHAAMMLIDRGEPNNALKLVQLADVHLADVFPDDPRVAPLRSWLAVESALAQAQMGDSDSAARRVGSDLARVRDGYNPSSPHARADMDLVTAQVHMHLGLLDLAEPMVATSVRTFSEGTDRREGVQADITLARAHVAAGEPDAPRLAASAIEAVAPLRSGIARAGLAPLAAELEARSRSDFVELARRARQVVTARM